MKMKMKGGLIVVVVIAAVMMLSSYASAQSPDEIIAAVLNNSEEITTYKFDMDMTVHTLTGNGTNVTEMTIKVNGSGVEDIINKSMWMAMNINMNTSGDMGEDANMGAGELPMDIPETIETEMYLINNTIYMKIDMGIPFMPWIKMEQPVVNETYNETYNESYLPSQDQLELLQRMLQNCTNVTLLDDGVVNDTDCYVLKLELDFKNLLEFLMNQTTMDELGIPGFENQDVMDTDEIEDTIEMMNMSMTGWIAKDTYLVMKAEETVDMTTTNPDTEEEATIAIDFNMRLYDYNVPVTIELPPEAEAAMDIGDMFGMLPEENEKDILPGGNETEIPR
ncbi:MAG: DUF6612 family protein [Euryarchaeota archaeon]|nr:DUF6612 family protein [Euryarchaeota archaeon]